MTKQESSFLLADVTNRGLFGGGLVEGEAVVLSGDHVGVVDPTVAGGAEGGLIRRAEDGCFILVTYITLDIHLIDVWLRSSFSLRLFTYHS